MVSAPSLLGRLVTSRAALQPASRPAWPGGAIAIPVAAIGLLALGGGPARASAMACGSTIPATTTLHRDLTNCPGDGLIIAADNITLDLNGHTIDGDGIPGVTAPNAGIRLAGHHGVALIGGTVQEFDTGVLLHAAPYNHLRRLTVLRNAPGRGIQLEEHSDDNRIEVNTSANNARSGISLLASDYNVLRDNLTHDNPLGGIVGFTASHNRIEHNISPVGLGDGSNDNVVAGNTASDAEFGINLVGDRNLVAGNRITRNQGAVVFTGDDNTITRNIIDGNGGGIAEEGGNRDAISFNSVSRTSDNEGIRINAYPPDTPPAVDIVIRANLVRDSANDGIAVGTDSVGTVTGTILEANLVIGSGHDGINVARAATTVTRNLALRNANLGIEAIPGVTDGGGNHAFGNGNPLECINIAC